MLKPIEFTAAQGDYILHLLREERTVLKASQENLTPTQAADVDDEIAQIDIIIGKIVVANMK